MEEFKKELKVIRESQIRMEEDVKHHIRRTDELQDLHEENTKRIVVLEKGPKARKYLISIVLNVGKVLGVALTIVAILKVLK